MNNNEPRARQFVPNERDEQWGIMVRARIAQDKQKWQKI